jgi:DNA-binding NarL/FixJ family response regulator
MSRSSTVLLVIPSEIIRAGVAEILGSHAKIVGATNSGKHAITLAKKLIPVVVLLCDRLPDADAFDMATNLIASTKSKVMMMGVEDNPIYLARASAVGVSDYVFEGSAPKEIVRSVLGVASGKPSATGAFHKLTHSLQDRPVVAQFGLTPREQQVARHIAHGLSNNEIAASLGISVETVKEHVQNVLRKAGMEDRTKVAVWAIKSGLV